HRCDIYSLGVMLYEMVVGEVPYTAETPMAVVVKHIVDPLPMPRAKNPAIPEELQKVILKSLAKNPDDRYQQISEIPQALERIVEAYPDWSAGEVKAVNAVREPQLDQPETYVIDEEDLDADLADMPTVGGLPDGGPTQVTPPAAEEPSKESAPAQDSGAAAAPQPTPQKKKRSLWPFFVGGFVVLAVLGVFAINLIFSNRGNNVSDNQEPLPPVAGEQVPQDQLSEEIENEPPEESVQRVEGLLQRGDFDRARQVLNIALSQRPELWNALILRVEQLENIGEPEMAAHLLGLGLEGNPGAPADQYAWHGWLLMSAGMPLDANQTFREALTREPFLVDAHDGLVNSAIAAEIVPDVIGFLENLQTKFPEEFQIYTSLGDLFDFDGQSEQALASYERAMEIEPNDPWTLVQAAEVYFYSDSPRKAQDLAARAVELAQDDPVVLGLAGFLYLAMEDYEQAFVVFDRAHQLDKEDAWNTLGLAESIFYTGRDKGQVAELLRFVENRGKEMQDAWMLTDMGWLYVEMDDCENAVRIFNEVEAFAPGETDAREGLAACN
ncbi:MAG TPA: tetratricopeptide repeat protein, partial [Anaerolineales bacterium]|nr:tetratricopeptide repeat protein [Anaerolineales bacterium]